MDDLEENIVLHTAAHVKQARPQQLFANQKVTAAKFNADESNNINHQSKVQTMTMDYYQNINLPYLGEDQPGDTYYFSSISIYCFGICNAQVT